MPKPIHPPTPEPQFELETSLAPRAFMRQKLEQCQSLSPADRDWLCRYFSQRIRHQDANVEFHRNRFRACESFLQDFANRLAASIIEGFLGDPKGCKAIVRDLEPNQP